MGFFKTPPSLGSWVLTLGALTSFSFFAFRLFVHDQGMASSGIFSLATKGRDIVEGYCAITSSHFQSDFDFV
jgi:hypothetical protein